MSNSYWGYWLIVLGIFIIGVMMFSQDVTTTSTKDYYQIKEAGSSAMVDAIDYSFYSQTGMIRMHKEVFIENFIRRFANNTNGLKTYKVEFYDLYEFPPKASVKITTNSGGYIIANQNNSTDIVSSVDLILEYSQSNNPNDPNQNGDLECEYYGRI